MMFAASIRFPNWTAIEWASDSVRSKDIRFGIFFHATTHDRPTNIEMKCLSLSLSARRHAIDTKNTHCTTRVAATPIRNTYETGLLSVCLYTNSLLSSLPTVVLTQRQCVNCQLLYVSKNTQNWQQQPNKNEKNGEKTKTTTLTDTVVETTSHRMIVHNNMKNWRQTHSSQIVNKIYERNPVSNVSAVFFFFRIDETAFKENIVILINILTIGVNCRRRNSDSLCDLCSLRNDDNDHIKWHFQI